MLKGNLAISTDILILYSIFNLKFFILRDIVFKKKLSEEILANRDTFIYIYIDLKMLRLFIIFLFF